MGSALQVHKGREEADQSAGKLWYQELSGSREEAIGSTPRIEKRPHNRGLIWPWSWERFFFFQLEKEWGEHSNITNGIGKSLKARENIPIPEHWKIRVAGTIVLRTPKCCPLMLRMQVHLKNVFQNQIASTSSSYSPRSSRSLTSPSFAAPSPLDSIRTQGPGRMG